MSPITKIALRRIKKNSRKSIFLTIAVLFSMLMISFFIFFQLQTLAVQNPAYKGLPFTEFMNKVRMSMNVTVVTLVIITFLTVRTYCSMRNEENKEALAVLTSVGATNFQKRKLIAYRGSYIISAAYSDRRMSWNDPRCFAWKPFCGRFRNSNVKLSILCAFCIGACHSRYGFDFALLSAPEHKLQTQICHTVSEKAEYRSIGAATRLPSVVHLQKPIFAEVFGEEKHRLLRNGI